MAQTQAGGASPHDYWLNMQAVAGAHLTGAEPARLRDWVSLLCVGELNNHVDLHVKPALATVLETMSQQVL